MPLETLEALQITTELFFLAFYLSVLFYILVQMGHGVGTFTTGFFIVYVMQGATDCAEYLPVGNLTCYVRAGQYWQWAFSPGVFISLLDERILIFLVVERFGPFV